MVGTTDGTVVKARSFNRLPESQKAAGEMAKRLRVAATSGPVVDDIVARHVYIRHNVELKKFGYTERFAGCAAARDGGASANHSAECRARIVRAMRADEESGRRVLETEKRVLRAAGVQAAGGQHDKAMTDDVRPLDDAEALRVWSELSELDQNLKGDTYISEDGTLATWLTTYG
eukprot:22129-Amphidinium_carterae.1